MRKGKEINRSMGRSEGREKGNEKKVLGEKGREHR